MRILVLDGIGSYNRTSGIIDVTAHRLGNALGVKPEWINWRAAMAGVGGSGSWEQNSEDAVEIMHQKFDSADPDEKFILLAYSGGNYPTHKFLDRYSEHHNQIAAVGFMSDPWRPRDRWQHGLGNPFGYGVCGENYTPIRDRAYWTAVPGDIITSVPADSLARYFADACYGDPDKLIADFISVAAKGRFQIAQFCGLPPHQWFFGLGPRIDAAIRAVNGYLHEGKHTTHYVGPVHTGPDDSRSLAERLADTIEWKVLHNPA